MKKSTNKKVQVSHEKTLKRKVPVVMRQQEEEEEFEDEDEGAESSSEGEGEENDEDDEEEHEDIDDEGGEEDDDEGDEDDEVDASPKAKKRKPADDDEDSGRTKKQKKIVFDTAGAIDPELKQKKSGVLYFPTIPPNFTVTRMREEMGRLGEIGRIHLTQQKWRSDKSSKKFKRYTEGWVEFASKSRAKRVALSIDNTPVTRKKRSAACDTMWNVKYLSGFKWVHLEEQMEYEKRVEKARMRSEINQAKRVAEHFEDQIEKGKHLKKLEEKVMKKNGIWEKFQREITQRKMVNSKKAAKKEKAAHGGGGKAGGMDDDLMRMIFADD